MILYYVLHGFISCIQFFFVLAFLFFFFAATRARYFHSLKRRAVFRLRTDWPVLPETIPLSCTEAKTESRANWAPSQYSDGLTRYGDFLYKDKTVVRHYSGNPYTSKTTSLYLDSLLGYSTGEFQALPLIVLVVFGATN